MLRRMVFAFVIVSLCASTVCAQDPPRRGGNRGQGGRGQPGMGQQGPASLLSIEDVRKELKITEEQTKKIEESGKKMREMMGSMRDLQPDERRQKMQEMQGEMQKINKEIMDGLNPDQQKRLKQLQYQRDGLMGALNNEEVKKELNLTQEQQDKIKAIQDDMRSQQREMFQGGGQGADRQEMQKKMEELRKSTQTKVEGVLTDEQKTKWKGMLGEPFKGNLRPQMRRPGGVIG